MKEEIKHAITPENKGVLQTEKPILNKHYNKYKIHPFEFSMTNNLDPVQHTIIKYVVRHEDKNGEEDLDKAIQCINILKEIKYG